MAFYNRLGLAFTQEQHGDGPVHFAFGDEHLVVEIYPAGPEIPADASGTMIGFEVEDVDQIISNSTDWDVAEPVKNTPMGRRMILRDPDGRKVFVYSQSPKGR